jgi:hypothetical protein
MIPDAPRRAVFGMLALLLPTRSLQSEAVQTKEPLGPKGFVRLIQM